MEWLFSWPGAILCGVYLVAALLVWLQEVYSDAWVLRGYVSYIFSLPGMYILKLFGFDPEDVLLPATLITALIAYLTGAAVELAVRAIWP